jgi:flagellar motor protein MotB
MATDYARMKAGMPELDKAKTELKKLKEREIRESAWVNPAIDILSAGLSDEIKSGKAEVLSAGNRVIVNISESALYMPGSYTFLKEKESQPLLRKLDSLLRDERLKGKTIIIGNTTEAAPAQGKGRKKIPPKDARTLAADRSAVLIKYLEKNGVNKDALVAGAYSSQQPGIGFKLKSHKTVIIVENPLVAPPAVSKQEPGQQPQSKPTSTAKAPAGTVPPQGQPVTTPIKPAQPKTK